MGTMREPLENAAAIAVHAHYVMFQLSHLHDATPASPLLMLLRTPLHMQKSQQGNKDGLIVFKTHDGDHDDDALLTYIAPTFFKRDGFTYVLNYSNATSCLSETKGPPLLPQLAGDYTRNPPASQGDSQRCNLTGFEEPRHKNTPCSSTETATNHGYDGDDGTA